MSAEARADCFCTTMRKYCASLMRRVQSSTNSSLSIIASRLDCRVQSAPAKCSSLTNLLMTRAGPCSSVDNETIVAVSELSVFTRIFNSSVSGRFNVSEDINNGWDVKVIMQKCQDIRNLDTCDYFRSFLLISNGCQRNDDDVQTELYNMFFRHIRPRLSCPIKAGSYRIETYPFQTEDNYITTVSGSKISTSVFGYTLKLEGFLRRRKIFCLEAYLQLLYTQDRAAVNAAPSDADDSAEPY